MDRTKVSRRPRHRLLADHVIYIFELNEVYWNLALARVANHTSNDHFSLHAHVQELITSRPRVVLAFAPWKPPFATTASQVQTLMAGCACLHARVDGSGYGCW